jgi:hypothetical protein
MTFAEVRSTLLVGLFVTLSAALAAGTNHLGTPLTCLQDSLQHVGTNRTILALRNVEWWLYDRSGIDDVSCRAATARTTTLRLGVSTSLERSPLHGYQSSATGSLKFLLDEREALVMSACASSAYARRFRGESIDVAKESRALQLRQGHRMQDTMEDICTNVVGATDAKQPYQTAVGEEVTQSSSSQMVEAFELLARLCATLIAHLVRLLRGEYNAFLSTLPLYWFDEVITIRASNLTVLQDDYLSKGLRGLLQHAQKHLRVHVFPPSCVSSGSDCALQCDLDAVLLLDLTFAQYLVEARRARGDESDDKLSSRRSWLSWWDRSALSPDAASLMHPHCQFRLTSASTYTTSSGISVGAVPDVFPLWLRRALGLDSLISHTYVAVPDMSVNDAVTASADPPLVSFEALCVLHRRVTDDPVCVMIHDNNRRPSASGDLYVTSAMKLDVVWTMLFVSLVVVSCLRPIVLRHPLLQVVLCFALGVLVFLCVALYMIIRDLQRTRIGKAGLVALLASGGVLFAVEGLMSAVFSVAFHEIRTNNTVHAAIAVASFVSAIFSQIVLRPMLPTITSCVFTVAQGTLVVLMLCCNREASLMTAVAWLGWIVGLWSVLVTCVPLWILWLAYLPLRVIMRAIIGLTSVTTSAANDGDPLDNIPVFNAEPQYCKPLAATSLGSRAQSAEERLDAYERQGSACTRRALEALAATVRDHPEKYISRVRDPNGLARFAGV